MPSMRGVHPREHGDLCQLGGFAEVIEPASRGGRQRHRDSVSGFEEWFDEANVEVLDTTG
jgi:hypothetical protein